jgi:hypothetical protein
MVLLAPGRSFTVTVCFGAGPTLSASTRPTTVKEIEVRVAHLGMAWNPGVLGAVADTEPAFGFLCRATPAGAPL